MQKASKKNSDLNISFNDHLKTSSSSEEDKNKFKRLDGHENARGNSDYYS